DLGLGAGSDAIDAADNTAIPAGVSTDFAGANRFLDDGNTVDSGIGPGPIADIGAFEFVPAPCPGDTNGDGFTNLSDFSALAGNFGATGLPFGSGQSRALGDLNDDGEVNLADFSILGSDFGCTP
ncbi:MAG: dockerin type I domain-containing protein, partial [Planctomycetota bacterium]